MCGRARRSAVAPGCAGTAAAAKKTANVSRAFVAAGGSAAARREGARCDAACNVCDIVRLGVAIRSHRFEAAQTDTFDLVVQPEIGELRSVRVGHDNKGFSPGWCGRRQGTRCATYLQHGTRHARHSME